MITKLEKKDIITMEYQQKPNLFRALFLVVVAAGFYYLISIIVTVIAAFIMGVFFALFPKSITDSFFSIAGLIPQAVCTVCGLFLAFRIVGWFFSRFSGNVKTEGLSLTVFGVIIILGGIASIGGILSGEGNAVVALTGIIYIVFGIRAILRGKEKRM